MSYHHTCSIWSPRGTNDCDTTYWALSTEDNMGSFNRGQYGIEGLGGGFEVSASCLVSTSRIKK